MIHKDQDNDNDLNLVLKESLRTRTRINISVFSSRILVVKVALIRVHRLDLCQESYAISWFVHLHVCLLLNSDGRSWSVVWVSSFCDKPRAGSGVVRIDPLHFLAGCHTRRLNQDSSVLYLSVLYCVFVY